MKLPLIVVWLAVPALPLAIYLLGSTTQFCSGDRNAVVCGVLLIAGPVFLLLLAIIVTVATLVSRQR